MPRILELKVIDDVVWARVGKLGELKSGVMLVSPEEAEAKSRQYSSAYDDGYRDAYEVLGNYIHYPYCWDTAAYPTLGEALAEIGCNPEDCACKEHPNG